MSQLTKNTTDLDALIAKANALPDAVDTSDADATADDIVSPKTAYVNGEKITGNIPSKSSSDLTVSGATVNVPAGHYKQAASKSVATATQATPSISVNSSGLITASATQTAGYVAAGTKSGTKQLTQQAAKTVTPTKSEQTAVAAGVYTTGAVKVAKIPDSYVQPSGTKNITENGTHDVTSFASVDVNVAGSGVVNVTLIQETKTHISYFDQQGVLCSTGDSTTIQPLNGVVWDIPTETSTATGDYLELSGTDAWLFRSDGTITISRSGSND